MESFTLKLLQYLVIVNTFRPTVTDIKETVSIKLHDLSSVNFQSQERILSCGLYVSTFVDLTPGFK